MYLFSLKRQKQNNIVFVYKITKNFVYAIRAGFLKFLRKFFMPKMNSKSLSKNGLHNTYAFCLWYSKRYFRSLYHKNQVHGLCVGKHISIFGLFQKYSYFF